MIKEIAQKDPATKLKGVGPSCQKALAQLKIKTVFDLLNHFPFRYLDFSLIKPIKEKSR